MTSKNSPDTLSASVQLLPLPAGLYVFTVEGESAKKNTASSLLAVPALHVSTGPGVVAGDVEFMSHDNGLGGWLFTPGDFLVVKLKAPKNPILITSVRDETGDTLAVKVERLDSRYEQSATTPTNKPVKPDGIPLRIKAHIQHRGDVVFDRSDWAGSVSSGRWLEAFAVTPLDTLKAKDIEYKGLTASGFETPWISDGQLCGTQQIAVPLLGFAVRLKKGTATNYDCIYTGYFHSGKLVGPLKNGAPCRSIIANDALEGIRLRIILRNQPTKAATKKGKSKRSKPLVRKTKQKAKPSLKKAARKRRARR